MAPASVYSHFADLNALVEHVLRLRYQELAELMGRAASGRAHLWKTSLAVCRLPVLGDGQSESLPVVFGGRAPSDVFPSPAHEAGAELLAGVAAALAAATTPMARQAQAAADHGPEQLRAGLLLWQACMASSRCTTTATTRPGRHSTSCSST